MSEEAIRLVRNDNIGLLSDEEEVQYDGSPWFVWVQMVEPGKVVPISYPDTCREGHAGALHNLVNNEDKRFDTKKALQICGAAFRSEMKELVEGWEDRVQKLFNAIEEDLGWLKTRCVKVETPGKTKKHNYLILIVSSRRWMKAPPILSLQNLLIRNMYKCAYQGPKETKLEKIFDELRNEAHKPGNRLYDSQRMKTVMGQAAKFLRNYGANFEKKKQTYYLDQYDNTDGIQSFLGSY